MDIHQKSGTIITISLFTIISGVVVIIGWLFNIPALQTMVPGFVAMAFNAAVCFILFGSALLTAQLQNKHYNNPLFFILSLLGTLIAFITLLQNIFHFNSGLDQLFVTDTIKQSRYFLSSARMAFNSSLCFFFLGLGFLSLTVKTQVFNLASQFLFHAVTILSAIVLIGYLYGVSLFNSLFYVTSMATHTAILLFVLSLAASLLKPSSGITGLFTGQLVGNQMAKRFFTLMFVMVILFGVLRFQTQRLQVSSSVDIEISLIAICFLLVSLLFIWYTANWLNKADMQRSTEFQKSEERYQSLFEHASDAIYIIDSKRNFTHVNESMCKMTGYSEEELLQLNVEAVVDPEELKTNPLPNSPTSIVRERRFVHKSGRIFTVEVNAKKFTDNMILVIARDITDRKKMEEGLREAELKFRTIAEKSMVGVYIVQNGRFIYVNPRFAEVFGYEPEELVNAVSVDLIIHDSYRETVLENVRRRIEGETESIHYEALGKKKDGTPHWIEFYGSRAIIGNEPTIIGSMIDINKRKNAEELILKEKMLSDTIINSLPGVFYLYNNEYQFLRWNKNFEALFGYIGEEIKKMTPKDLIAGEDYEAVEEAIGKVFIDGYAMIEARGVTKDGRKIPFLFTGTSVTYENQQCLLGTGIDISSRLKAEEELKSSENKYKLLFDSNPSPMWMIARDDMSIIAYNEAAAKLYGYENNELLNKSATLFRPPEDLEIQRERYEKDMDDYNTSIVRHLKKDGTMMYVQIIAHDIIFEGRPVRLSLTNDITEKLKAEELLQQSEANLQTILKSTNTAYALFDLELKAVAFNQKAIQFVEEQYKHTPEKGDALADYFSPARLPKFIEKAKEALKGDSVSYEIDYEQDNGAIFWYYVRLSPITNENKKILGMLLALYDITERKNAEQDLQSAYKRIQTHIESIKDMAWKQSHLIRSPLANLKGLSNLLKDDPADSEALAHIQQELDRMDTIIIEMADEASGHEAV